MIVYFCALLLVVGGLVYMRLSSSSGGGDKPNTASTMLIDGTQSQKSWLLYSYCLFAVLYTYYSITGNF